MSDAMESASSPQFEDILDARRTHSDFFWATYDGGAPATTAGGNDGDAAKNAVLASIRLRETIETLARESCSASCASGNSSTEQDDDAAACDDESPSEGGVPISAYREKIAELYTESVRILNEMGHQFSSSTIRLMGFMLSKVFKRLYTHVWVERNGIEQLRQLMAHMHQPQQQSPASVTSSGAATSASGPDSSSNCCPVILVPTHRSYVDFLLLSFVLFTYNLQVPLIVAGIDFLKMSFVAHMLRQSGAFFIRRSFSDDRLYWTLFSQYVQELLRMDSHPLEFFIEGTRSRSGKSLYPRAGMLHVVAEMWAKGRIYDACFVPVTIDYDRPLEESLHIRELLGSPKPPESTAGLVKAMSILRENFGTVRVAFHKPLMLRDCLSNAVDRSLFNLMPAYKSIGPAAPASPLGEALNRFALLIVLAQTRHMHVMPFQVLCSILLQEISSSSSAASLNGTTTTATAVAARRVDYNFSWLSHRVLKIWICLERLVDTPSMWFDQQNHTVAKKSVMNNKVDVSANSQLSMLENELRRACHIHHNILTLNGGFVTLKLAGHNGAVSSSAATTTTAPPTTAISDAEHDNNIFMMLAFYRNHLLALAPITSVALQCVCAGNREYYKMLCDMFSREFVCIAATCAAETSGGDATNLTIHQTMSAEENQFMIGLIMPFIKVYYIVFASLYQVFAVQSRRPHTNGLILPTNVDASAAGDFFDNNKMHAQQQNDGAQASTTTTIPVVASGIELRCASLKVLTKHLQSVVRQLIFDNNKQQAVLFASERELLSLDTITNAVNWLKSRQLLLLQQRADSEGVYVGVSCGVSKIEELHKYVQMLRMQLMPSNEQQQALSAVRNGLSNGSAGSAKVHSSSHGSEFAEKIDSTSLGEMLQVLCNGKQSVEALVKLTGKL